MARFSGLRVRRVPAESWDADAGIVARYYVEAPPGDPFGAHMVKTRDASRDWSCDCGLATSPTCDGRKVVRALARCGMLPGDEVSS